MTTNLTMTLTLTLNDDADPDVAAEHVFTYLCDMGDHDAPEVFSVDGYDYGPHPQR